MKIKGLLVLIMLASMGAAFAKGPPQKVTISGAGLAGEIVYMDKTGDAAMLEALGTMMLEDYTTRTADAPEGISGEGYLLTRYFLVENGFAKGSYVPFDQVRYYPGTDGGRGYVHYIGIIGGSSEYDGQWFRASADGEAALQALITGGLAAQTVVRAGAQSLFLQVTALLRR